MMHKKRLEGIRLTEIWEELLKEAEQKCQEEEEEKLDSFDADDDAVALLSLARETLRGYASSSSQQRKQPPSALPIRVVLSLAAILGQDAVARALEGESAAAAATSLAFTPEPDPGGAAALTEEQRRFRKRIERLSLKREEERYGKLTNNLGLTVPQDDVTTRTMTYAASVGLNMIVAPLSFGCFMWFFSGPVLDYAWPSSSLATTLPNGGGTDIRRVIIGVLSGCGMLFVEMLLFVIRTHELDRAVRAKSKLKKNQAGPFGYYTSNTAKAFKDD
jgi:hypothetical protein